jgi:hypothetical protein
MLSQRYDRIYVSIEVDNGCCHDSLFCREMSGHVGNVGMLSDVVGCCRMLSEHVGKCRDMSQHVGSLFK